MVFKCTISGDQNCFYAKITSNMGFQNLWRIDSELQLKVGVYAFFNLDLKVNSVSGQVCKAK